MYVCEWTSVHMNVVPTEVRGKYQSYFSKRLQELELQEVVGWSMWVLENELYSLLQEQYELVSTIIQA